MWIVRLALRRPYTFVVVSMLIALLGIGSAIETPKDIFPYINIPVVTIVWTYSGLTPAEMEGRVVTVCERALTTTVNDMEHTESESYQGVAIIKVYFQPQVKVELALAQITSVVQTILRVLPPGSFPPFVIKYDASSVPIVQLGLSGQGLSESDLYDDGLQFIRPRLANVKGASVPLPFGGKVKQVMVDTDPNLLFARHLSATDVSTAISQQNLILPAGTARLGDREFVVKTNSSPDTLSALNDLPIRASNGAVVYVKDVAQVHMGFAEQTNIVRENGKRSALLTVLKNGETSTLDIVSQTKAMIPRLSAGLGNLTITPLFDQSIFVRTSINEVVREACIAAALTGLMILLFLGSWRSTLIVCISIPLSIATSLIILAAIGQTINVMTLGGLALAVGILVDDATVEIENTHRNMAERRPLVQAILHSAQQVAAPAFVSTLSICIVFIPVVLLTGAAKYLFTPLAEAVAFAMMASYFLSRTLVPTMMHFLLGKEIQLYQDKDEAEKEEKRSFIWRWHSKFDRKFERLQHHYKRLLDWCLDNAGVTLLLFGLLVVVSLPMLFFIGKDFFPYVDSGQMKLHVNPPPGLRLEDSEQYFAGIEKEIRQVVPVDRVELILDNIGLPNSGINLAYGSSATISNSDGDILIALKPGKKDTQKYTRLLRDDLNQKFPDATFFFTPANITNQILDFGLPAPIDLQVIGRGKGNYELAMKLAKQVAAIPGAVDVHIHQQVEYPTMQINVDRTKARQIGLTQQDVSQSTLISLTGTGQTAPNEWLNPATGVNYQIVTQTPVYRIDSLQALARTPVTTPQGNASQLLGNVATFRRDLSPIIIDHYNIQPTFDVYADVDRRDLGGVASEINKIMDTTRKGLPKTTTLELRGEVKTMNDSFLRLGIGIVFAIMLVYLLMAVNFQSWLDPLIILMAIPCAFCGILWMLFLTQTTFSVPSLMGAIMTIGVATANSILMVVFANDERLAGKDRREAALNAGHTRLRPVLMTALAMIIGMLPMALAFGEGGEQNAPLGRAVIGGLLFATLGTLFLVPTIYSLLKKHPPVDYSREIEDEAGAGAGHGPQGADSIMANEKEQRHEPIEPDHRLPWPEESDPAKVGEQFADPNAADDRRVGRSFEESNFSGKKHHTPLTERVRLPQNRKVLWWFLVGFGVLFLIVVLAGALPRFFQSRDTKRRAREEKTAKPVVETATVQASEDEAGLVVPGTMIPLTQAFVYARANGYLKKRFVDIGDHVEKNQLLALIDAPDLDAQVIQAREQVAQAQQQLEQQRSQLALNTVTVQRYRVLVQKGVFSRQDGDTQEANYRSQEANVAAAQRNVDAFKANLQHQIALQSYEQVRAPFAGVVTERDVDQGALISASGASQGTASASPQGQSSSAGGTQQAGQANNAGSSGATNSSASSAQSPGSGGPLFGIAQVQRLRILVSVPEGYATAIHVGQRAPITVQEYAGTPLFAEVTRTAASIDANTRTMLTELQIDNAGGKLLSGMYAVVTFPPAPGAGAPLLISGDAVAIRHDKQMVATVRDGKIRFVPVTLGRDFGSAVEVLTGLKQGDVIVTDVTDDVADGREVTVHAAKSQEQQQQGASQNVSPGGNTQYGNQGLTDQNLQGQQSQQNQKSSGKGQSKNKPSSSESKQ